MRGLLVPALAALLTISFSGCLSSGDGGTKGLTPTSLQGSLSVQSTYPGTYKFDGRFSQVLAEGVYKVLPQEQVYLKSKLDGRDIQLVNWRPDVPEGLKVPVIIQASPYYGDTTRLSGIGLFIVSNFVPHGYVYTQLAIRSTGDSGGCDDFRGPKMTADMSQAIDWLAEQPWSNGNVAIIGISYVGTTPWYAAGSGNPHLKTIVPISGSTNAWEVYNRNGSAEGRSPTIIANYGTSPFSNPNRSVQHKAENIACPETYQGWAIGAFGGVTGEKDPFRAWWDERNAKPKVEKNYKGSIFVVHGFEDWNVDPAVVFPWSDRLNQSGLHVKTLVGQWPHSYPDSYCPSRQGGPATSSAFAKTCRWDWAEILLHWFDYWLKGIPTDLGPAAQVQDNQMRWRNEDHWPPRDADWTRLHLSVGGVLKPQPGAAGSVRLLPLVAGNEQLRAAPVPEGVYADFTYGPFEQELSISGLPRVHVTVTPHGPGGYLGAYLMDRDPAAALTEAPKRIGWTSMNLRYHEGGDAAKTVVPNQPIVARMEIQPMEAVLPAGHVLVLRVWVNPHADRIPSVPPSALTLSFGGNVHSVLELPLIERAAGAYFEPPMPPK